MAISEFEIKRCEAQLEKFMAKHRPPEHVRAQVDFGYSIENQSVELFEIRPHWNDPSSTTHTPIAKATFVKRQKIWKVYWHKSDMKWHSYEPQPTVNMIENFLSLVGEDQHACFFG